MNITETLTGVAQYYASHWNNIVSGSAEIAQIYGWFAAASLAALVVLLIFAIFNRERGKVFAGAVGQHVLFFAAPYAYNILMSWV